MEGLTALFFNAILHTSPKEASMTEQERKDLQRANLRVKGLILRARFQSGPDMRATLSEALLHYGCLLADCAQ